MIAFSIYPDWMKLAKITPLYEKGERNLPENYRSISLISFLRKICKKTSIETNDGFLHKA